MIHSMTGFGRAAGTAGTRFHINVAVKSVNHKFLEVSVRVPEFLWELESIVRTLAVETFSRGKIDISLRVTRLDEPDYHVKINRKIADKIVPQIRATMEDLGIAPNFTVNDLLRVPDFIKVEAVDAEIEEEDRLKMREIVLEAFKALQEARQAEGESLKKDFETRIGWLQEQSGRVTAEREGLMQETLLSYRTRVNELAALAGTAVDPDRLAQETVIMVEKMDVAEEMTRLTIHLEQFRKLLEGTTAVGKKLDFLTQEILREINTLGAKSRAPNLRSLVVELKTEAERIREQVQNVE